MHRVARCGGLVAGLPLKQRSYALSSINGRIAIGWLIVEDLANAGSVFMG
jgi:predicted Kef-type K+ transport protein